MAWPVPPLDVEVSLALGADPNADPSTWTWTVITSYVYFRDGIRITRGRRDEQTQVGPSVCRLTLDNRDGRFSPRNPVGAYYGQIGRNTPLRVRVRKLSTDSYTTRYVGFVSEWPQRWDPSEADFYVPIQADGILRRLGQGSKPLKSALYRAVLVDGPKVYWPMEDGVGANAAASGLSGGTAMVRSGTGTVEFQSTAISIPGSAGAVDARGGGSLVGAVNPSAFSASSWQFDLVGGYATSTPGTPEISLAVYHEGTADFAVQLSTDLWDGNAHHVAFQVSQNGGDVDIDIYYDGVFDHTTTVVGQTLGRPTQLVVNLDEATTNGVAILSHIALFSSFSSPTTRAAAMTGYTGDPAGARFTRLCGEEGIFDDVVGTDTQTMGAQTTKSLLELLRECEAASAGVITERLDGTLGLDMVSTRYAQTAALTLDYDQGQITPPLEPTDDDLLTRNDVTVAMPDGSSARAVDDTGALGTASVGVYDEQVSINVSSLARASDHAWWRLHLGTVDELRFPRVTLNLRRASSLASAWLATDIGDLITITNLPDRISYDDVDLIVEGYGEYLDNVSWDLELNCSPSRPYEVTKLGTSRLTSSTATLATGIDSDDTSLSVTTGTGGLWTTAAGNFPQDILIEGERITLSGISGAASPQTFTASARSVNGVVKAHLAGASVEVWRAAALAL